MKSSPRFDEKRTAVPSGVQFNTVSSAECEVNCLTVPPAAGMRYTSRLPLRSDEKAIHLPSGEKRGYTSRALWTVRRWTFEPSSLATHTSPR
jgi:hypothetical protein